MLTTPLKEALLENFIKKGNCVGYVITIEGKTILEFEIQNITL
jgi:hypothetical protein